MMVRTLLPATPATSGTLAARAVALLLLPIRALLMLVLLLLPLGAGKWSPTHVYILFTPIVVNI